MNSILTDILAGRGCDMLPCAKDRSYLKEDDAAAAEDRAPDRIPDEIRARIDSGEITEQKSWKYIREMDSFSDRRLDSPALIDCCREYTYRQMFRKWELYSAVFSALGITGKSHSRVALIGTPAAETISAFYALNMTGTSVSMVPTSDYHFIDRWEKMVEKEGITDIFLNDVAAGPDMVKDLLRAKKRMGIRYIIILHIPVKAGELCSIEEEEGHKRNCAALSKIRGVLFMEDLLEKFMGFPAAKDEEESSEAAVIVHTSGTTSGIHKPVPLSDTALNESVDRLVRDERFAHLNGRAVTCLSQEMQASYIFIDGVHLPLAFGGVVVTIPAGSRGMGPIIALSKYRVNVMFASALVMEPLMRLPITPDFSHLEFIFLGGSYSSADTKKRYDEYLKSCGSKVRTSVGYGMSEAGAACILASADREDDSMGYPLSGVKIKVYDEEKKKYYDPEDGQHTGVLYISSKSLSGGRIDDTVFFELTDIDGEKYYNTNDQVRVNKDGSLTFAGRVNKYYVNHEGVRFDAGLVETAVSAQPGIEACGLAPEYNKIIHDTIPVLYVKTADGEETPKKTVRTALKNVFIKDNRINETNMPGMCVIADDIPFNDGGKVDVYRILSAGVRGKRYSIAAVRDDGELKDIKLVSAEKVEFVVKAGLPEEIETELSATASVFGKNAIGGGGRRR